MEPCFIGVGHWIISQLEWGKWRVKITTGHNPIAEKRSDVQLIYILNKIYLFDIDISLAFFAMINLRTIVHGL